MLINAWLCPINNEDTERIDTSNDDAQRSAAVRRFGID